MILEEMKRFLSFIQETKSPSGRTNIFFTMSDFEKLFQNNKVHTDIRTDAAVLGYPAEGNVWRIYFYCRDAHALSQIKEMIGDVPQGYTVVCDIVGKEPSISSFSREMQQMGYSKYARFQRMVCKEWSLDSNYDFSTVEMATLGDTEEVQQMLYETFDPVTAHFPTIQDVRDWISEGEVFVVRDPSKDRIAGLASFLSNHKRVACLNYFIVRKEFQRKGIARRLLLYKLLHHNSSESYYIWINEKCAGAIEMYEKFHFHTDGLFDDIFTL